MPARATTLGDKAAIDIRVWPDILFLTLVVDVS
jgi:hypothetical protein